MQIKSEFFVDDRTIYKETACYYLSSILIDTYKSVFIELQMFL